MLLKDGFANNYYEIVVNCSPSVGLKPKRLVKKRCNSELISFDKKSPCNNKDTAEVTA